MASRKRRPPSLAPGDGDVGSTAAFVPPLTPMSALRQAGRSMHRAGQRRASLSRASTESAQGTTTSTVRTVASCQPDSDGDVSDSEWAHARFQVILASRTAWRRQASEESGPDATSTVFVHSSTGQVSATKPRAFLLAQRAAEGIVVRELAARCAGRGQQQPPVRGLWRRVPDPSGSGYFYWAHSRTRQAQWLPPSAAQLALDEESGSSSPPSPEAAPQAAQAAGGSGEPAAGVSQRVPPQPSLHVRRVPPQPGAGVPRPQRRQPLVPTRGRGAVAPLAQAVDSYGAGVSPQAMAAAQRASQWSAPTPPTPTRALRFSPPTPEAEQAAPNAARVATPRPQGARQRLWGDAAAPAARKAGADHVHAPRIVSPAEAIAAAKAAHRRWAYGAGGRPRLTGGGTPITAQQSPLHTAYVLQEPFSDGDRWSPDEVRPHPEGGAVSDGEALPHLRRPGPPPPVQGTVHNPLADMPLPQPAPAPPPVPSPQPSVAHSPAKSDASHAEVVCGWLLLNDKRVWAWVQGSSLHWGDSPAALTLAQAQAAARAAESPQAALQRGMQQLQAQVDTGTALPALPPRGDAHVDLRFVDRLTLAPAPHEAGQWVLFFAGPDIGRNTLTFSSAMRAQCWRQALLCTLGMHGCLAAPGSDLESVLWSAFGRSASPTQPSSPPLSIQPQQQFSWEPQLVQLLVQHAAAPGLPTAPAHSLAWYAWYLHSQRSVGPTPAAVASGPSMPSRVVAWVRRAFQRPGKGGPGGGASGEAARRRPRSTSAERPSPGPRREVGHRWPTTARLAALQSAREAPHTSSSPPRRASVEIAQQRVAANPLASSPPARSNPQRRQQREVVPEHRIPREQSASPPPSMHETVRALGASLERDMPQAAASVAAARQLLHRHNTGGGHSSPSGEDHRTMLESEALEQSSHFVNRASSQVGYDGDGHPARPPLQSAGHSAHPHPGTVPQRSRSPARAGTVKETAALRQPVDVQAPAPTPSTSVRHTRTASGVSPVPLSQEASHPAAGSDSETASSSDDSCDEQSRAAAQALLCRVSDPASAATLLQRSSSKQASPLEEGNAESSPSGTKEAGGEGRASVPAAAVRESAQLSEAARLAVEAADRAWTQCVEPPVEASPFDGQASEVSGAGGRRGAAADVAAQPPPHPASPQATSQPASEASPPGAQAAPCVHTPPPTTSSPSSSAPHQAVPSAASEEGAAHDAGPVFTSPETQPAPVAQTVGQVHVAQPVQEAVPAAPETGQTPHTARASLPSAASQRSPQAKSAAQLQPSEGQATPHPTAEEPKQVAEHKVAAAPHVTSTEFAENSPKRSDVPSQGRADDGQDGSGEQVCPAEHASASEAAGAQSASSPPKAGDQQPEAGPAAASVSSRRSSRSAARRQRASSVSSEPPANLRVWLVEAGLLALDGDKQLRLVLPKLGKVLVARAHLRHAVQFCAVRLAQLLAGTCFQEAAVTKLPVTALVARGPLACSAQALSSPYVLREQGEGAPTRTASEAASPLMGLLARQVAVWRADAGALAQAVRQVVRRASHSLASAELPCRLAWHVGATASVLWFHPLTCPWQATVSLLHAAVQAAPSAEDVLALFDAQGHAGAAWGKGAGGSLPAVVASSAGAHTGLPFACGVLWGIALHPSVWLWADQLMRHVRVQHTAAPGGAEPVNSSDPSTAVLQHIDALVTLASGVCAGMANCPLPPFLAAALDTITAAWGAAAAQRWLWWRVLLPAFGGTQETPPAAAAGSAAVALAQEAHNATVQLMQWQDVQTGASHRTPQPSLRSEGVATSGSPEGGGWAAAHCASHGRGATVALTTVQHWFLAWCWVPSMVPRLVSAGANGGDEGLRAAMALAVMQERCQQALEQALAGKSGTPHLAFPVQGDVAGPLGGPLVHPDAAKMVLGDVASTGCLGCLVDSGSALAEALWDELPQLLQTHVPGVAVPAQASREAHLALAQHFLACPDAARTFVCKAPSAAAASVLQDAHPRILTAYRHVNKAALSGDGRVSIPALNQALDSALEHGERQAEAASATAAVQHHRELLESLPREVGVLQGMWRQAWHHIQFASSALQLHVQRSTQSEPQRQAEGAPASPHSSAEPEEAPPPPAASQERAHQDSDNSPTQSDSADERATPSTSAELLGQVQGTEHPAADQGGGDSSPPRSRVKRRGGRGKTPPLVHSLSTHTVMRALHSPRAKPRRARADTHQANPVPAREPSPHRRRRRRSSSTSSTVSQQHDGSGATSPPRKPPVPRQRRVSGSTASPPPAATQQPRSGGRLNAGAHASELGDATCHEPASPVAPLFIPRPGTMPLAPIKDSAGTSAQSQSRGDVRRSGLGRVSLLPSRNRRSARAGGVPVASVTLEEGAAPASRGARRTPRRRGGGSALAAVVASMPTPKAPAPPEPGDSEPDEVPVDLPGAGTQGHTLLGLLGQGGQFDPDKLTVVSAPQRKPRTRPARRR